MERTLQKKGAGINVRGMKIKKKKEKNWCRKKKGVKMVIYAATPVLGRRGFKQ